MHQHFFNMYITTKIWKVYKMIRTVYFPVYAFNPGNVINKFLKIFCNKKTNFYASKWGFSPLKFLKNWESPWPPNRAAALVPRQGPAAPWNPASFMVWIPINFIRLDFWFIHTFIPECDLMWCLWWVEHLVYDIGFLTLHFFYLTIVWICCPLITPHFLLHVWKMMKIW